MDWNIVLFYGMERTSHWAALYFIVLMTFGNYVPFNLLVAILVEGFKCQVGVLKLCGISLLEYLVILNMFQNELFIDGVLSKNLNVNFFQRKGLGRDQESG